MSEVVQLHEKEYSIYANNARAVYKKRKAHVPEELPGEEDIKEVRNCIEEISRLCTKIMKDGITEDHRQLARVTLVRLITFNVRRGREPSKLQLVDWEGVKDDRWKPRTDIPNLSDPVEITLAKRLKLCYVEEKKDANGNALVPILFTAEAVTAIGVLMKYRREIGISQENQYVFARGVAEHFVVGRDTLPAISKQIELKKPKLITPTRTRKWLATMMQLLDLTNSELTWLTNHMGHTKNVHMSWYRKEVATIELTKVAKVLSVIDGGEDIKNKIDTLICFNEMEGKLVIILNLLKLLLFL